VEMAGSENQPPYDRALALTEAGFTLLANGDLRQGEARLWQSLPHYRQATGQPGMILSVSVHGVLGHLAGVRGDYATASEQFDEGQAVVGELREDELTGFDRLQHLLNISLLDSFRGQVRLSQGDNDTAARLFANSLAVARRADDAIPILVSLYQLALSTRAQGDLAGAAGHLKEGLAMAAEIGDDTTAAYYLEALADVAGQQDNPQRAARLLAAARSQLEASGSGWLHAYIPRAPHSDAVLAALRARMGDAAYEEALAWAESVGTRQARQYALQ
jgi:tetratricopeptide (TPR) repeat protein